MIRLDEVFAWLHAAALPFWHLHGLDREHGGFVEHLDLHGANPGAAKRTRAQCRQFYCMAEGAALGWEPGRAAAAHGWAFLTTHHARADGGWVRSVTPSGAVLDATRDAYDIAFVLFAHAARLRMADDPAALASALATVEALDAVLGRGGGKGWDAAEDQRAISLQNPHMHLFEAAIDLAAQTGHPRFRGFAEDLLTLFHARLFDAECDVVRECHAADWSRIEGAEGDLVEPGHLFEWAWLLLRAERLLGLGSGDVAQRLYRRATSAGVSPRTGLVYDAIDGAGRLTRASSRCWPQTERLKAALAMFEHGQADTRTDIAEALGVLLDRYLAVSPHGCWGDQLDAEGRHVAERIPSTTFYHIMVALSELSRLRPLLAA